MATLPIELHLSICILLSQTNVRSLVALSSTNRAFHNIYRQHSRELLSNFVQAFIPADCIDIARCFLFFPNVEWIAEPDDCICCGDRSFKHGAMKKYEGYYRKWSAIPGDVGTQLKTLSEKDLIDMVRTHAKARAIARWVEKTRDLVRTADFSEKLDFDIEGPFGDDIYSDRLLAAENTKNVYSVIAQIGPFFRNCFLMDQESFNPFQTDGFRISDYSSGFVRLLRLRVPKSTMKDEKIRIALNNELREAGLRSRTLESSFLHNVSLDEFFSLLTMEGQTRRVEFFLDIVWRIHARIVFKDGEMPRGFL